MTSRKSRSIWRGIQQIKRSERYYNDGNDNYDGSVNDKSNDNDEYDDEYDDDDDDDDDNEYDDNDNIPK